VYQTEFEGIHHELGTSGFLYRSNKWGEWRKRHPATTVLSLNTGHQRDYGEGVAYHDYFATDELMFTVPELDNRLLNKDEVLALRDEDQQLAMSVKFLAKKAVHHDSLGDTKIVVPMDGP